MDRADSSLLVDELDIVTARDDVLERQTFIGVDRAVRIVFALIRAPICRSGRREVHLLDGRACEIPEPQALGRRPRRAQTQQGKYGCYRLFHIVARQGPGTGQRVYRFAERETAAALSTLEHSV